MAILLSLSIIWPVMSRRRQAAALEGRRTLAARARPAVSENKAFDKKFVTGAVPRSFHSGGFHARQQTACTTVARCACNRACCCRRHHRDLHRRSQLLSHLARGTEPW